MKKYQSNNDQAIGAVGILAALIFYIFALSIILSFVLTDMYGVNVTKTIILPSQKDIRTFTSNQSYISGAFDLAAHKKDMFSNWTYTQGLGLELKLTTINHPFSYLLIDYLQEDSSGLYQNSYWLNNSVGGDYAIILRYTGSSDQNEIRVEPDGFHIPNYFPLSQVTIGDKYFYPYPNADQVVNPSIKTIYNDNNGEHYVDFYFNGDKFFTTTELNDDTNLFSLFPHYYGGVGSNTIGFIITDFQTESSIISGLNTNALDSIAGLLVTILKISTWQIPSWILPTGLVAFFINLPEAGIVICIAIIVFRGVD